MVNFNRKRWCVFEMDIIRCLINFCLLKKEGLEMNI